MAINSQGLLDPFGGHGVISQILGDSSVITPENVEVVVAVPISESVVVSKPLSESIVDGLLKAVSSLPALLITYPIHIYTTHDQIEQAKEKEEEHTGGVLLKKIFNREGILGFYNGVSIVILQKFFATFVHTVLKAIFFAGYLWVRKVKEEELWWIESLILTIVTVMAVQLLVSPIIVYNSLVIREDKEYLDDKLRQAIFERDQEREAITANGEASPNDTAAAEKDEISVTLSFSESIWNMWVVLTKIFASWSGVAGLWNGILTAFAMAPSYAVSENFQVWLCEKKAPTTDENRRLSRYERVGGGWLILIAAFSRSFTLVMFYPLLVIKGRLFALDSPKEQMNKKCRKCQYNLHRNPLFELCPVNHDREKWGKAHHYDELSSQSPSLTAEISRIYYEDGGMSAFYIGIPLKLAEVTINEAICIPLSELMIAYRKNSKERKERAKPRKVQDIDFLDISNDDSERI